MLISDANIKFCKSRLRLLDWYHKPNGRYALLGRQIGPYIILYVVSWKHYKRGKKNFNYVLIDNPYFDDKFPTKEEIIQKYMLSCLKQG